MSEDMSYGLALAIGVMIIFFIMLGYFWSVIYNFNLWSVINHIMWMLGVYSLNLAFVKTNGRGRGQITIRMFIERNITPKLLCRSPHETVDDKFVIYFIIYPIWFIAVVLTHILIPIIFILAIFLSILVEFFNIPYPKNMLFSEYNR